MSQQELFDTEDRQRAVQDLVRIADQMETCENSIVKRELSRDYKNAMIRAGITDKRGHVTGAPKIPKDKLENSRLEAIAKITSILDNPELLKQVQEHTSGKDMFIISTLINYKGILMETNLEHCDSFYRAYSGYACIKARKSLISQKQLKGYPTIEYGLISFGIDLIKDKQEKIDFYNKYAVPYNENLKKQNG